jgi:hypothetical protein
MRIACLLHLIANNAVSNGDMTSRVQGAAAAASAAVCSVVTTGSDSNALHALQSLAHSAPSWGALNLKTFEPNLCNILEPKSEPGCSKVTILHCFPGRLFSHGRQVSARAHGLASGIASRNWQP